MVKEANGRLSYRKVFARWKTLASPNSVEILVLYVIIPTFLLLDPVLLWSPGFKNVVNTASADVPNIMFLHPGEFIHFATLRFSQGGLNGPYAYVIYLPLAVLILIFKLAGIHSQLFLSGVTLASAYLGMSALVRTFYYGLCVSTKRWAGASAGIVFTLFPLVAQNFWITYQPRLYLVAVLPWLAVLVIKFVREPNFRYILLGAGVVLIGSAAFTDIPGSMPAIIALAIICVTAILTSPRPSSRNVLVRIAAFIGIVTGLNAVWILPWMSTFFLHQDQATYALSSSGKNDAIALVRALQPYQSVAAVAGMRLSNNLINFGTSQLRILSPWLNKLWVLGVTPWITCIAAFALIWNAEFRSNSRKKWISFSITFVLAIIWLAWSTMKLPGSLYSYKILTTLIPGWVATRTFYEAFTIAYAFSLSLSLGIALLLIDHVKSGIRPIAIAIIIAMTVFGNQLLVGGYFRLAYSDQTTLTQVLSSLPTGYNSIISKLRQSHQTGSVLSLPLSTTSWTSLYGRDSQGKPIVYVGQSPLFFRWGIVDYNGLSDFSTGTSAGLTAAVENDITNMRTQNMLSLARVLGIRWVIIEHLNGVPQAITWALAGGPSNVAQRFDRAFTKLQGVRTVARSGRYVLLSISHTTGPVVDLVKPNVGNIFGGQILTSVAEGLVKPSSIFSQECYNVTKVESSLNYSTYRRDTVRINLRSVNTSSNCRLLVRATSGMALEANIVTDGNKRTEKGTLLWPGTYIFRIPALSKNSELAVSVTSQGLPSGIIGAILSVLSIILIIGLRISKLLPSSKLN
ncbi:MAG: hypothetical protein JRN15_17410 [Nitrososphaerota archaeon]|nr:hypothetical protein [Nitrososphaerota archaeon]